MFFRSLCRRSYAYQYLSTLVVNVSVVLIRQSVLLALSSMDGIEKE
jgi:hypothetical protein